MRVYVPGHIDQRELYLSGGWEPTRGYAVTPALLEISAAADPDDLAELPKEAAAQASVVENASPLRLVMVVDYPRADVAPIAGEHLAAVALTGRVTADAVVCAFVDEPGARAEGEAAARGDDAALEALSARDLLWYDADEIAGIPTV